MSRSGRNGFSILEVMVASAILAIVLSLLFSSLFGHDQVDRAARDRLDNDQAARIFLEQLDRDFKGAFSPAESEDQPLHFLAEAVNVNRRAGYRLAFPFKVSDAPGALQATYLTESPADQTDGPLIITRGVFDPLRPDSEEKELICRRVASLQAFFVDETGESETLDKSFKAPATVRIILTLFRADGGLDRYTYLTGPLTALAWGEEKQKAEGGNNEEGNSEEGNSEKGNNEKGNNEGVKK